LFSGSSVVFADDLQVLTDQIEEMEKAISQQRMGKCWKEVKPAEDAYFSGDYKKTFKILKPLAEKGCPHAQYTFGRMYELGGFKGIGNQSTSDIRKAIKWYEIAAKQGNRDALFNLASIFYNGNKDHMILKDYVRSAGYSRQAAESGDEIAQFSLGKMYVEGKGVIQDYIQAHMWFNVSNSNGHKPAIKLRDIIEKKMSKQQVEEAQKLARNWKPKKK
jgi:hypothetical protein